MKLIPLTQGQFAQVDDEDFDYLNQFKWRACRNPKRFYAVRTCLIKGKYRLIQMHRVIMRTPNGLYVDHIDHNGLNNQKNNLRNCTILQNSWNKTPRGNAQFIGVTFCKDTKRKKRYKAAICTNGKMIYAGRYATELEAAIAYDRVAFETRGEFASLNFPEDYLSGKGKEGE